MKRNTYCFEARCSWCKLSWRWRSWKCRMRKAVKTPITLFSGITWASDVSINDNSKNATCIVPMKHEYKGTCGHTIVSSPCITPLSIPLCLHKRIPCTVVDSLRKTCRESHNISSKSWITLEFMFYNYSNIQNQFNPQPRKVLSQKTDEHSPKWVVKSPCSSRYMKMRGWI